MGNKLLQRIGTLQPPADCRIIDLGCGTGDILESLYQKGFTDLVGLDLSSGMIDVARQKAPVDFLHASMESIPVEENHFDLAVSNAAIQWCDAGVAASEIHRVLRADGTLLLNSFVDGTLGQWRDAFLACDQEPRVHLLANIDELKSAFTNCGFAELEVKQHTETSSFESIESMFASIRQLGATNAMSSRKRPMTRIEYNQLTRHFEKQLKDNGVLDLDFIWVELMAKKMAR